LAAQEIAASCRCGQKLRCEYESNEIANAINTRN
jgi:hypothetical protein